MKFSTPKNLALLGCAWLAFSCQQQPATEEPTTDPTAATQVAEKVIDYTPNWESLSKHNQAPDWFADAKLGIYFHWGPFSVPAYHNEWYPAHMYQPWHKVYKHHVEKYGGPEKFNYHDFIPQFKGENFDAKEWAELFKASGAKFAGPCAQHHDGFAMWDSKVNPWNAKDRGPKKDITGELTKAIRALDMKVITTFHHAKNLQRYADKPVGEKFFNSHFPYSPKFATSSTDPDTAKLYGNIPAEQFHQYWFDQLAEVIDQYSPDIIWFDTWLNLIPAQYRQEFAAYYLNHAHQNNQEVVIAYKQNDLPESLGVLDIEQGGKKDLSESVWLTDVTLSKRSWCYTEGMTYKTASMVVRNMIDVWSKNGVVLLNISPMANGIIPNEQRTALAEIGGWLKEHGEAVYNTRPFYFFGFGTAVADEGHFGGQSATVDYKSSDVRFTQSKDGKSIYVFFLGKPKAGTVVEMRKLGKFSYELDSDIKSMTVLGTGQNVEWKFNDRSLDITIPEGELNSIATVMKIALK